MLFIAEIGLNHNGNFDLIYEMIRRAKGAGADIAKFQTGWRQRPDEINHMNPERLAQIKKWCDYFEIEFMSSVLTEEAYAMLRPLRPRRYKIASRTIKDNPALAERIVRENDEVIVSLGMWEDSSRLPFQNPKVTYLWCRSKYPTQPWDLTDFPKDFRQTPCAGYSDHTIGIETAIMAVCRGARIIEKHFTLDKSDTTIRDHSLSATPEEFRLLVDIGRDIERKLAIGV